MKIESKEDHQRVSAAELGEILTKVGKAYHHQKKSPSQFFDFKQRFQLDGLIGLKEIESTPKSHPCKTSCETIKLILDLSLQNPNWGCIRLGKALKLHGINISSPTIQKILIKNGMANRNERVMILEEKVFNDRLRLTSEQMTVIEKVNPCFKERAQETSRPGEFLVQDTLYIGLLQGIGKIYLQIAIDTYTNYAFALIHVGKLPDFAVSLLHNEVIPFFKDNQLVVSTILTDNGREFCGRGNHHYELYLSLNDIEHRKLPMHQSQTNGFLLRFERIVKEEFFRSNLQPKYYENLVGLQSDFEYWINYYNRERPHQGYPNQGKPPTEMFHEYRLNN